MTPPVVEKTEGGGREIITVITSYPIGEDKIHKTLLPDYNYDKGPGIHQGSHFYVTKGTEQYLS
jgi:hypothetical protein